MVVVLERGHTIQEVGGETIVVLLYMGLLYLLYSLDSTVVNPHSKTNPSPILLVRRCYRLTNTGGSALLSNGITPTALSANQLVRLGHLCHSYCTVAEGDIQVVESSIYL